MTLTKAWHDLSEPLSMIRGPAGAQAGVQLPLTLMEFFIIVFFHRYVFGKVKHMELSVQVKVLTSVSPQFGKGLPQACFTPMCLSSAAVTQLACMKSEGQACKTRSVVQIVCWHTLEALAQLTLPDLRDRFIHEQGLLLNLWRSSSSNYWEALSTTEQNFPKSAKVLAYSALIERRLICSQSFSYEELFQ